MSFDEQPDIWLTAFWKTEMQGRRAFSPRHQTHSTDLTNKTRRVPGALGSRAPRELSFPSSPVNNYDLAAAQHHFAMDS